MLINKNLKVSIKKKEKHFWTTLLSSILMHWKSVLFLPTIITSKKSHFSLRSFANYRKRYMDYFNFYIWNARLAHRERGWLSLHKHVDEVKRSGLPRRSRRRRSIYRKRTNMCFRAIYTIVPSSRALRPASRNQLLRTRWYLRGAACVLPGLNLVLHLSHVAVT